MFDPTKTKDSVFPDDRPNIVVVRAKAHSRSLACCIYLYRSRSNWMMTTDLSEPPAESAVWMVPANKDKFEHQTQDACRSEIHWRCTNMLDA